MAYSNIKNLSGIRFFLALSVVLVHLYGAFNSTYSFTDKYFWMFGNIAVTYFFLISGYLTANKHLTSSDCDGLSGKKMFIKGLENALVHIKKWYLLYLITFLCSVALSWPFGKLRVVSGFFTVLTLQCLLPWKMCMVFNLPLWYLSAMVVIYMFVPALLRVVYKIREKGMLCIVSFLVIAILFCSLFSFDDSFITYCFPFYRIFQFFIGMMIFCIVEKTDFKLGNILNFAGFCLFITHFFGILNCVYVFPHFRGIIPASAVIFLLTSSRKDFFAFSNSTCLFLSAFSLDLYLMHYPFIYLFKRIDESVGFVSDDNYCFVLVVLVILIFVISWFHHFYGSRFFVYKKLDDFVQIFFDRIASKFD